MNSKPRELKMKMHELLSDESKWSKGALARDASGKPVRFEGIKSPDTVCWCVMGAAVVCYPDARVREKVLTRIRENLPFWSISNWQDKPERTFEEVRAVLLKLDV